MHVLCVLLRADARPKKNPIFFKCKVKLNKIQEVPVKRVKWYNYTP